MSKDNSPSSEENQELPPPSNPTIGENPDAGKDTLPPAPNHGWLEQFSAFGIVEFQRLEEVAKGGLVQAESELLIALAVKLTQLAMHHDPQALDKLYLALD